MNRRLLLYFLIGAVAAAQNYGDGIWAAASTVIPVPPDLAKASLIVSAPAATTLETLLPKLKDAGISIEHLEGITIIPGVSLPGVPPAGGSTTFSFGVTVSLDQVTATLARFTQLGRANTDLQIQARSSGVGTSAEAIREAQKKAFAPLFREAKARAEQIAADAGLPAGRVLSIVDTYGTVAYSSLFVSTQIPMSVGVRLAIE